MTKEFVGPVWLSVGFRPFFIGCGAWAIIVMSMWISALSGYSVLPDHLEAVEWHYNEFVFGVIGAAMAGFVLTAVPNWTGNLPLRGRPLMLLFALWCAGRFASVFGTWLGAGSVVVVDSAFLVILCLAIFREIAYGRNWRNLPVALVIGAFGFAHILFYLEALGTISIDGAGQRLGLAAIACLLTLIGGRIVPSFTRNWLNRRNQEGRVSATPGRIDTLAIIVTTLGLVAWIVYPAHPASGFALILAGILVALRLARWRGWRTLSEPLLFVLHVGYAWLALSLVLLGGSVLYDQMTETNALHALSVGAAGTMILAVMSRAILGHTGRDLRADRTTVLVFCSISTAALARLSVIVFPSLTMELFTVAGGGWIVAFSLFLWRYAPMAFGR